MEAVFTYKYNRCKKKRLGIIDTTQDIHGYIERTLTSYLQCYFSKQDVGLGVQNIFLFVREYIEKL